jgi:hypothetical protein
MPLPRLDFAVHDRRGQTVFVLELDQCGLAGPSQPVVRSSICRDAPAGYDRSLRESLSLDAWRKPLLGWRVMGAYVGDAP